MLGDEDALRVEGGAVLDARADDRRLRLEQRHRLPHHVRAHQRAVGVVVLEERDHRGGDADDLLRADVHVVDDVDRLLQELVLPADEHPVLGEAVVLIERGVGLRDVELLLLRGIEVDDLVGHDRADADLRHLAVLDLAPQTLSSMVAPALATALPPSVSDEILGQDLAERIGLLVLGAHEAAHLAVRRLDEAVLVDLAVRRQRADQADVRAFRRLDRADPAVVGRVHVADVEAGALAAQATRAQRGEASLVGQLGQRVRLVHELAELAAAEELLHGRHHRADVDQRVRRRLVGIGDRHALLDDALHAQQADAELVLDQLADGADAPVAEVVDVVGLAAAVVELDQLADDRDDVVAADDAALARVGALLGAAARS